MFGYVTIDQKGLEDACTEEYRAWYCGLCRSLREKSGQTGRLFLSNDMTFLALLLSSVYEPDVRRGRANCPLHPAKKRPWVRSDATEYAADMNLLLTYYHLLDNARDDNSFRDRQMAKGMEKSIRHIRETYPRQCAAVEGALEEIRQLEEQDSRDIDALCDLSGRMLGEVFAWRDDFFAPPLRAVGHGLGRFIYLMDAWEDLEEDVRRGRFNPLKEMASQRDYEALIMDMLTMILGETRPALEVLPLEENLDIIENVFYHGVWTRYALVQAKREAKQKEGNKMRTKEGEEG